MSAAAIAGTPKRSSSVRTHDVASLSLTNGWSDDASMRRACAPITIRADCRNKARWTGLSTCTVAQIRTQTSPRRSAAECRAFTILIKMCTRVHFYHFKPKAPHFYRTSTLCGPCSAAATHVPARPATEGQRLPIAMRHFPYFAFFPVTRHTCPFVGT